MSPHDNSTNYPEIDCVMIGVNCQKTLGKCIASIKSSSYPPEKLHLYYVDGGSNDESVLVAAGFPDVRVISLNPEYPTPGLGRNQGWKNSRSPFVQFLDSDTLLDPEWLKKAVGAIEVPTVGAVLGYRREMHPGHSVFNWIGDLEWNGPPGESDCFGGDVLIRRTALEKTGGYDEVLVGGEDPELSRRIITAGWRILRLDTLMTRHDLAMTSIIQYLRRAFRSGYGFAAVKSRESRRGSTFWKFEWMKILIKGGGFLFSAVLSMLLLLAGRSFITSFIALFMMIFGSVLLCSPRLFRVEKFMKEHNLNRKEAKTYAWHCSLVVLPQMFGMFRFYAGHLFNRPLRNRRRNLATELTASTP
jgi:glycosyltransferase involved in cell wall biosynthesis